MVIRPNVKLNNVPPLGFIAGVNYSVRLCVRPHKLQCNTTLVNRHSLLELV